MKLSKQKCVPCEGGVPPIGMKEAEKKLREYSNQLQGWKISQVTAKGKIVLALKKTFRFKKSMKGADFVHALWKESEKQDHHPDIELRYSRVNVRWTTHSAKGLAQNDFIMAAATEETAKKFMSS